MRVNGIREGQRECVWRSVCPHPYSKSPAEWDTWEWDIITNTEVLVDGKHEDEGWKSSAYTAVWQQAYMSLPGTSVYMVTMHHSTLFIPTVSDDSKHNASERLLMAQYPWVNTQERITQSPSYLSGLNIDESYVRCVIPEMVFICFYRVFIFQHLMPQWDEMTCFFVSCFQLIACFTMSWQISVFSLYQLWHLWQLGVGEKSIAI